VEQPVLLAGSMYEFFGEYEFTFTPLSIFASERKGFALTTRT
jgi:hypothetical protein